jgi:hypothetical protein
MKQTAPYHLTRLRRKYLLLRSGELFLWSIAAALITASVLRLFAVPSILQVILAFLSGGVTFVVRLLKLRLHHIDDRRIIRFIDQRYPELEFSSDLLLKEDHSLTTLQRIQKERTITHFNTVYPAIRLPHNLRQATLTFTGSILLYLALSAFVPPKEIVRSASDVTHDVREQTKTALPASIRAVEVGITPPAYTGLQPTTVTDPQLTIPEGSSVQWRWTFTEAVRKAQLLFSSRDSLPLRNENGIYVTRQRFSASGFYQLQWTSASGEVNASDYFRLEVIEDKAPEVAITGLPQFITLPFSGKLTVDLHATLNDDYGLKDTHIIATVSKGSGESVKFREERLRFTTPAGIRGKNIEATKRLDLVALGMEPGDELYFYVEAFDIRTPQPNHSRTETYFIALQDTTTEETSVDAGRGVDLMPEYFRSQRQIIIDTEKLLREKKHITSHAFKSRSNELGYDQKVLRLKYGEFLGEEFESGIAVETEPDAEHDHEEEEDVTKKFGHVHDKENEHNLVEDKKPEAGHDHHEHEKNEDEKSNPLEAFMHMHDDPEEATFFIQSIRTKLKAALTVMWDAELYLRLYEPEKSLPYQYKALKLLKEISNDSRIYVHKTGFDPPPIKEDKRLTADLSGIESTTEQYKINASLSYPAIRRALELTERLLLEPAPALTASSKAILLQAGNELSAVAVERPAVFLKSLSLIKALREDEIPANEIRTALSELRRAFWIALPHRATTPGAPQHTSHPLDHRFIQHLEDLKHE